MFGSRFCVKVINDFAIDGGDFPKREWMCRSDCTVNLIVRWMPLR